MEAVAYSNFRKNLRSYMKQVNEDADALIVTTKDVENTIVVFSNDHVMDKIRRGDKQFEEDVTIRGLMEVELGD